MKKFKVGLQLYSVRDFAEKDFFGTLEKVADMGYEYIEFAGFGGKNADELKNELDRLGLKACSMHGSFDALLEEKAAAAVIADAKTIATPLYVLPWMDAKRLETPETLSVLVNDVKKAGKLLKDNGIMFGYHNHDFEFGRVNGKCYIDILYDAVPADCLVSEFDTAWVRFAGYDPASYIRKYAGRAPIVHLKDFICDAIKKGDIPYALVDENDNDTKRLDNKPGFEFRPIGHGVQDIPAILAAAEFAGSEYIVVEQDDVKGTGMNSLECAAASREYLRSIGQ